MDKKEAKQVLSHSDFFLKNHRGVSQVITAVILIGISLLAVGVGYFTIKNVLESSAEKAISQSSSLNPDNGYGWKQASTGFATWVDDGDNIYCEDCSVGIGTTGPQGTLDVNGPVFSKSMVGYYGWGPWNPFDVVGNYTNAPASGTSVGTTYYTFSNPDGNLTISFNNTGLYIISISWATTHAGGYDYDDITITYSGTATKYNSRGGVDDWGSDNSNGNIVGTQTFLVSATAGQTLSILPRYRIGSAGATTLHTAYTHVVIQYTGT